MKTEKIISAVLAVVLAASVSTSCGKKLETAETAQTESQTSDTSESSAYIPMTILGTDISKFEIVCASELPAAATAASELQKYIRETTGSELAISRTASGEHSVILEAGEDENAENYSVKTSDGNLIISGGGPRGILYGVYDFLEKYMGWRFFASDTDYLTPAQKLEIEDVDYSESPALIYREALWTDYLDEAISVKRRINLVDCTRNPGVELGGALSFTGGACHTLADLYGCDQTESPCLSDPATYDIVLKNVMALLDANPDATLISVSQNDNTTYCTCDECKKVYDEEGSPSGMIIRFVNKIADEVAKKYPNVMIHTFAYRYSRKPPLVTVPRDNVMVQLCTIDCCFNHALDDKSCPVNAAFSEDIEGWSKICKHLYIWNYSNDYCVYLTPYPNFDVLAENVRYFYKCSAIGVFDLGNGSGMSGQFGELRAYLISKLLWDPEMTDDEYYAAMDEFLRAYYGDGWEYIRKFIDFIIASGDSMGHFGCTSSSNEVVSYPEFYKNLAELESWFDKASEMTTDEKTLSHIERAKVQFTFVKLNVTFDSKYYGGDEDAKKELLAEAQALSDTMWKYNIWLNDYDGPPTITEFNVPPMYWY